jgi:hypothetical protein
MLTGSFAMNYYAAPRMTRDVDIVVNMTKKDIQPFLMTFSSEYHTSEQSILDAITRQSVFNIIHEEHIVKVDFVLRKNDPYRLLEFKRREKKEINGTTVYCVSQEDLILSKLAWGKASGSQMQEITDTSPEMEEIFRMKMMKLSGERRFMMGVSMYDTARMLVEASLPKDITLAEKRRQILTRFYGVELSEDVISAVASRQF